MVQGTSPVMAVSGNGPGFSSSEHDLIFEPYQIAHDPGSQPPSLGRALAGARRLARLMEGRLTCERTGRMTSSN